MPQGLEEEEHNPSDSQAGHRIQGEAGQIQVGSGEDSVVVEPLPAAEGALRAPRRHPSGVPRSRMRSHLLAVCSTVMLGVLKVLAFDEARFGLINWHRRRYCPKGFRPPYIV